MTKESLKIYLDAVDIRYTEEQLDVTEEKYCVHLNEFTENDMW